MPEMPEPLKPLKTWSHLAKRRKRPSEYEVVSVKLHYHTNNPDKPWELDPDIHMNEWYRTYRNNSPLKHEDWDEFRDPDALIYRTYNLLQDGQENYVWGLFDQMSDRGHDKMIAAEWVDGLARFYTPSRFPFHALQMASAYVQQMAPASTITNCCTYQAADHLRWVTHTAYRTRELANHFPGKGFAESERDTWEQDEAWQGIRELLEKVLVAWDWGEAFTALNLVAKPAVEAALLEQLGDEALRHNDTLLDLLTKAQLRDAERHRRWAGALVKMALEQEGNADVLKGWIAKYMPLADAAVEAYCNALPEPEGRAEAAKESVRDFQQGLGLA